MEKHIFDPNQPGGSMSLENMRNVLRALFQGDLFALRPRAAMVMEDFEYPTDALAQSAWGGTGEALGEVFSRVIGVQVFNPRCVRQ